MPTAFTVDASGSAFEPADDSPQWSRLLAITDFAPVVDPERGVRYPGTYTKSFSIPPAAAPPAAAPGNVSSLAPVTVLAGSGVADTLLDVSAIFQSSSRTGPLQYALIPAGFVPLAGTTRVQSLAPSSPDEYEWIGTSLELLPKFPDNATLLSDKTYEAVQKVASLLAPCVATMPFLAACCFCQAAKHCIAKMLACEGSDRWTAGESCWHCSECLHACMQCGILILIHEGH